MTIREDRFIRLRSTVERLSQPAEEQERYLDALGVADSVDELALEFDDAYRPVRHMLDTAGVSKEGVEMLSALDAQLDAMSGEEHAALWRRQALRGSPEWESIRIHARSLLRLL